MDEIKQKILSLINKQAPKIPSMGFSDENYHFPQATLSINSKTVNESDRPADQDILESIEAAYFSQDPDFDICRFELGKLPDVLDCGQIQLDFKNLKTQHQVVSKKVLQLILEHQSDCNSQFDKVLDVLEQVKDTLELCRSSRRQLGVTANQYKASLGILGNHRKRKLAQNLLDDLKTIKHLWNFELRLQQLLQDEDYAGAIIELKNCQKMASSYRHFHCVAALTVKLQETLENTDSQLDKVLAKTCLHFDGDRYRKLLQAYNLLDRSEISMIDNLQVHYITAIYNTSLNVVHSHVTPGDEPDTSDSSGKNPYKMLCQSVPHDLFIPCLVQLCKVLFRIVLSYYQLIKWHNNEDSLAEINRQKLDHNLTKIWDDVQRKVSSLLLNANLSSYKFDQFMQVLGVVHKLMNVGEEFCNSKSEDLQESIRKQSLSYFKSYHQQRLEELKIFLEHDSWEMCPVKQTFSLLQLQEFKSLRGVLKNFRNVAGTRGIGNDGCSSSNHSQDGGSSIVGNYFVRYADRGTPFDSGLDETIIDEDILTDPSGYYSEDSEEESEELKRDFVDEYADEKTSVSVVEKDLKRKPPHGGVTSLILTNTTLTVLRQIGKYLQMSRLLTPISFQIVSSMNQLFDYYLYAVHSFFAVDLTISSNTLYTAELTTTLKKIADNLVSEFPDENDAKIIGKPNISPMVNLKIPEHLHGLAERIVGVESVVFLAKQYEFLQDFLEFLIPPTNRAILQQFFAQSISSAEHLRKPIYLAVVAQAFDLRQILVAISKVNWEVRDVMSQHNSYIDMILREVQIFMLRLEDVSQRIPVGPEVSQALWQNIAHIITHTLVQGYSEAKKCSPGGRAWMQLDYTQFFLKFEQFSGLRPCPHREYVENYVKAYYLPETELENFVKEHTEYSAKHLFGLVTCCYQTNKKNKQRMLQSIEENEKQLSNN